MESERWKVRIFICQCIKLIHGKTLPSKMSRSFTADYCSRAIITVVSVRPELSRQTQTRLPLQIQHGSMEEHVT